VIAALGLSVLSGAASAAPPSTIPFSPSSPFNLLVPPNAPVASNGSSLSGATLGVASAQYTPAVFVSSPSDPVYTIRLTNGWGPNALNGKRVRLSPSARRGDDADGHMTIVVPGEDLVISLYQAEQGPRSDGTWRAAWGGMAPLSGSGGNRSDSIGGRESGISQLAGLITPDDVRRGIAAGPNGDLGHALALLHSQNSNRTFVPPAIRAGGNSSSGLYMGQRVFLDPTLNVSTIHLEGGSKEQRFGRLVANTMQRYGAIVVTNSAGTGFQLVNPSSWTSIGQPNPWPELIGRDRSGYYNFTVRAIPSSRLRAMAPSGGAGVPPAALAAPALVPAPTPTAAVPPTAGKRKAKAGTSSWAALLRRRVVRSPAQVSFSITVRSRRAGTVRVGASLDGTPSGPVFRRAASVAAQGLARLVVRVPVVAGAHAKIALVITVTDAKGRLKTLRREALSVQAPGA
jgi:hypothetical protein